MSGVQTGSQRDSSSTKPFLCNPYKHSKGRLVFHSTTSHIVFLKPSNLLIKCKIKQARINKNFEPNYFEVIEEGSSMLKFPFNVEGNHPWTPSTLSLHHFVLGVRRQACVKRGKTYLKISNLILKKKLVTYNLI